MRTSQTRATLQRRVWRIFKSLGIVGHSRKKNIFGVHPIIISSIFIILTLFLAEVLRKLVKKLIGDNIFKTLLLEFIATLELCAACFELIIVADNWGVEAYAIYLFILTVWWSKRWEDASACPYISIEDAIEGSKEYTKAALIVLSQMFGAILTFSYIQVLWDLELAETHAGKADEDCVADLQVDMITGAIIEAVATCLCRVFSRVLSDTETKHSQYLDAFFGTLMVVAAFNYSGGYFNPALASSLKFGCEGNDLVEHIVVYWLGSILGSVLSVFIMRTDRVQKFIKARQPKHKEE